MRLSSPGRPGCRGHPARGGRTRPLRPRAVRPDRRAVEEFRVRWAAHNVKFHRTGVKRLHHPIVGDLTLTYEAFELPADTGQRMLVYTAEPDSPSQAALNLLASWTSTPNQVSADHADEE